MSWFLWKVERWSILDKKAEKITIAALLCELNLISLCDTTHLVLNYLGIEHGSRYGQLRKEQILIMVLHAVYEHQGLSAQRQNEDASKYIGRGSWSCASSECIPD